MKHQKTEIVELILPDDRISNIPDNVAETILMCLPTRDAVRTSILSRRWRHMWATLPQFVLDRTFWENVVEEHSTRITLIKILYQLLTHRDGPITKFMLSNSRLSSCQEIDNLIYLLARRNLEDFTLEMWRDCYLLPNSFFSCQNLRHLRLKSCSIKSFPDFKGFCMLNTLKLDEVTIDAEMLSSLISRSPLLVDLELSVFSCSDIYIDAPNLRTFTLRGTTKSIMFQRVPVLASVSLLPFSNFILDIGQFFQPLLLLESLKLNCYITENIEHMELPTTLIYLKDLKLSNVNFNKVDDVLFTFWLLNRSPYLKFIEIEFISRFWSKFQKTTTYMELEGGDYSDIWLSELKEVELYRVTGTKPELDFTRLLLANSSSLKKFHIWLEEGVANEIEIREQVTKFPRLSNEVEIIFEVMTPMLSL